MERALKGNSIIDFPDDFAVVDIETTGLSTEYDSIIEISAIRVRNKVVSDTFSQLIYPGFEIDEFIENLTGITNEMLKNKPTIEDVLPLALNFIGDDIVVGHNVNFDINFIYDDANYFMKKPFSNNFIDTLRISRKLLKDISHHRLSDVAERLEISQEIAHRGLADCETTLACYNALRDIALSLGSIDDFKNSFKKHKFNAKEIIAKSEDFDETHPLYEKYCVFTGTLENLTRSEAAQLVVNVGGICENTVTKNTNYLVIGNKDYGRAVKDGKSTKHKKAEAFKLKGNDIEIITESVFFDLLN